MNAGPSARLPRDGVAAADGGECQPDAAPEARWLLVVARRWLWVPLLGCEV